jgi:hypothetical protein
MNGAVAEKSFPNALLKALRALRTAANRLRQDLSVTVEIPLKEGQEAETVDLVEPSRILRRPN